MLAFVPTSAKRVIDVGCGEGRFGALLKERLGCTVWGIELNAEAAQAATTRLDRVLTGDAIECLRGLTDQSAFDCVVLNDLLEHLPQPELALQAATRLLAPGGVIVASIPNVRYFPVLWDLLVHRDWRYVEAGVLDRTHLRFFTRKSLPRLFEAAGLRLQHIEGIHAIGSWKFRLLCILSLGYFKDTLPPQFACVAQTAQDA